MVMTEKELDLVVRAENSLAKAKISRMMLLIMLLVSLTAMLYGFLSPNTYAYFSVAVVVFAIYLPQLGGPPYNELVALLVRIRSEVEPQKVDPLIDVLTRKP